MACRTHMAGSSPVAFEMADLTEPYTVRRIVKFVIIHQVGSILPYTRGLVLARCIGNMLYPPAHPRARQTLPFDPYVVEIYAELYAIVATGMRIVMGVVFNFVEVAFFW